MQGKAGAYSGPITQRQWDQHPPLLPIWRKDEKY